MKTIATVVADFSLSALGTRSRLAEELRGELILRRTLKRVLAARKLASVHLVVSPADRSTAQSAVADLDVSVDTHDAGPVPWRSLIASARKWSLDAWRGGLVGATVLDESLHPWVLHALAGRENADAVVAIPPAAPLLDSDLIDRMIDHFEDVRDDARLVMTQAVPGLSGAVYMPSFLGDLAEAKQPVCRIMAYHPQHPQRDMMMQSCYYSVPAKIAHAVGRCVTDTQFAVDRVAAVLGDIGDNGHGPDALAVSRWLTDHRYGRVGALPAEIEIELTTEDPLPESTLRPRGQSIEGRGPIDERVFERLVRELAGRDDVRIVLGGFGDPLMHPQFPQFVRFCRQAGVFALAVRTPAVTLDDDAIAGLIDARVDVINVFVDATTAETYRRVHNADCFDQVMANVDRMLEANVKANQAQPIMACEMTKTHETMDEMEAFYDYWSGRTGMAVLSGPSHYAGQWRDRSVMKMAPPARATCGRLFSRVMVLADGRVTVCDQDLNGRHALGSIADTTMTDLWTSEAMASVRRSHVTGGFDGIPLCQTCEEWHRP